MIPGGVPTRFSAGLIAVHLAALVLLGACSGSSKASSSEPAPPSVASTAAAPGTEVITFVPPLPSEPATEGACFAPSIAVSRPGVFRCSTGNQIRDPCFQASGSRLVCVADPTKPENAVTIDAAGSLQQVTPFPSQPTDHVWAMETADGALCTFLQGATGAINGQRLNYGCADRSSIVGDPKRGPIWTAERVVLAGSLPGPGTPVAITEVLLTKVWH
jgi:hypothetical protein